MLQRQEDLQAVLGIHRSGSESARPRTERWVGSAALLTADTFGFRHLLWVYSGRRGIHCWISDPAALDLSDDQRRGIVTFLEVIKGSREQTKKVNVRGPKDDGEVHPAITYASRWRYADPRSAVEILKKDFVTICLMDQESFRSELGWEALLALLPQDRGLCTRVNSAQPRNQCHSAPPMVLRAGKVESGQMERSAT